MLAPLQTPGWVTFLSARSWLLNLTPRTTLLCDQVRGTLVEQLVREPLPESHGILDAGGASAVGLEHLRAVKRAHGGMQTECRTRQRTESSQRNLTTPFEPAQKRSLGCRREARARIVESPEPSLSVRVV